MRKTVTICLLIFLAACGSNDTGNKKEETQSGSDITSLPEYKNGVALIASNDCLTCHLIDQNFTGPSYREIANRYAGQSDTVITYLSGKIIDGGKGVWGETYMTPHSGLSKDDADAMVKYILLLKNK